MSDDANSKLVAFAKEVICSTSIDSSDIQEIARRYGFLVDVPFDPARHEDPDSCAEPGDPWFELAGPLAEDNPDPLAHMRQEQP